MISPEDVQAPQVFYMTKGKRFGLLKNQRPKGFLICVRVVNLGPQGSFLLENAFSVYAFCEISIEKGLDIMFFPCFGVLTWEHLIPRWSKV